MGSTAKEFGESFRTGFFSFIGLDNEGNPVPPGAPQLAPSDPDIEDLAPSAPPMPEVVEGYEDASGAFVPVYGGGPYEQLADNGEQGGVELYDCTAPPTTAGAACVPPAYVGADGVDGQQVYDVQPQKHQVCKYIVHSDGTRERIADDDPRIAQLKERDRVAEQKKQQTKMDRAKTKATRYVGKPLFTMSVTLLEIALFIFELCKTAKTTKITFGSNVWQWGGCATSVVIEMGGKVASRIVEQNEWWRFITPMFLHVSIVHIVFNLIMQVKAGMDLEKTFGSVRLGLLYVICGVGGNLVSSCFLFDQIQAGASGSIFGLLGLMFVDVLIRWKTLPHPVCNLVFAIVTIVLSVLSGMMPGVDNFAHVGGLCFGLVGGFAMLPHLVRGRGGKVRLCVVIITFPLLLAMFGAMFGLFYGYVAKGNNIDCKWCEQINCAEALLGEDWCRG